MEVYGRAQAAGPTGTRLGEGPRWDAPTGRLLWVDIEAGALHVFHPDSGEDRALGCGAMVGATAPWDDDAVLVALADGLAELDLASGALRRLADFPHPVPAMRANDGACDPAGRFWIGTMRLDEAPRDSVLYRYDSAEATLTPVLTGLGMSNGLGWFGDRMLFIDSPTGRVDVLDYDAVSGEISNRRPFAAVPDATPDGLAIDDEGGVWVALHGGGQVRRFTADGEPDGCVEVPVSEVTACAFGGPDRRTLFVTTRGGLFFAEVPFSGPPAQRFGGTRSTAPSDADDTQAR